MIKKCFFALVVFFSLFGATTLFAQQKPEDPMTKMEKFLSEKGNLIVKDFHKAGLLQGQYGTHIKVDGLIIYEPGDEENQIKGLKIEVYEGGKLEKSNVSFIDIDEAISLSNAISYMTELLKKWENTNREYTEVIFSTKGGFQIGFYQKGTDAQMFSKSGVIGVANCYFSSGVLPELKNIIDKGIMLLNE